MAARVADPATAPRRCPSSRCRTWWPAAACSCAADSRTWPRTRSRAWWWPTSGRAWPRCHATAVSKNYGLLCALQHNTKRWKQCVTDVLSKSHPLTQSGRPGHIVRAHGLRCQAAAGEKRQILMHRRQGLALTARRWATHIAEAEADRLTPVVESLSSRRAATESAV